GLIESEFRSGKIKLLASTPTLASGVNLPARRVVIANINRYDGKSGSNKPITVLEYKQLSGRAGRPQYDKYGEAIIVGSSKTEEHVKQKGGRFIATEFGKKTSALYIDPLTSVLFRKSLQKISKRKRHTTGLLHLLTSSEDFFPKFSLRNKDYELVGVQLENY